MRRAEAYDNTGWRRTTEKEKKRETPDTHTCTHKSRSLSKEMSGKGGRVVDTITLGQSAEKKGPCKKKKKKDKHIYGSDD